MICILLITGLIVMAANVGFTPVEVFADPQGLRGQCDGILHQKAQEIWFGGEPGEGESICVIARAQVRKVLRVCTAGSYCRVVGLTDDCEGSGECLEMKRVLAVMTRKPPRRR